MKIEWIHKLVRQALATRGVRGVLLMSEARKIRDALLLDVKKKVTNHDIEIELSPVHSVGSPLMCDASKTKVIIKPITSAATHIRK